jgi:hypothetical protein
MLTSRTFLPEEFFVERVLICRQPIGYQRLRSFTRYLRFLTEQLSRVVLELSISHFLRYPVPRLIVHQDE